MATLLFTPDAGDLPHNLTSLSEHCRHVLPSYAIPIFVRIKYDVLDMTSTIKQTKICLKREGFDPNVTQDLLFYYCRTDRVYKQLNIDGYRKILDKSITF